MPEFQIGLGRSDDAERPYTLKLGISFSPDRETASFAWLKEVRSWKNARVERDADVVRFLSPDKIVEVDARNGSLVRISMIEGDHVGGGVERTSFREVTLQDSAFEPSAEDLELAKGKSDNEVARSTTGLLINLWLLGPVAAELPDDPAEWSPEGRKAIGAYCAAVWRELFSKVLDIDMTGYSAQFARDFLERIERKLGRTAVEQDVVGLRQILIGPFGKMFSEKIGQVHQLKELKAQASGKADAKSITLARLSCNAMSRAVGVRLAEAVDKQVSKLLREREKPEKAAP
jgi:hypothetical protein